MRGLNFRSAVQIEDLEYLFDDVWTPELFARMQAIMGTYLSVGGRGIVDSSDPGVVNPALITRPLSVSVNALNGFLIDVSVGSAFAGPASISPIDGQSGEWLFTTQPLVGLPVPSLVPGAVMVCSIKKTEVDYGDRVTDFPEAMVPAFRSRPGADPSALTPPTAADIAAAESGFDPGIPGMIEVVLLAAFQALSPADQAARVPLAVITVQAGPILSIDLTRATYAFNRPWFSPVDVFHRSQVGTGVASAANPHRTKISDLSAGSGVTAMELWTPEGVVVARDNDFARLPGFKCQETLAIGGLVEDDAAGTISGIPAVGLIKTKLGILSNYPVRLVHVSSHLAGNTGSDVTEIAAVLVKGRPIVAIPPHEAANLINDVAVTYTAVSAGQPPIGTLVAGTPPRVGANLTSLLFQQPVTARRELIISRGTELDAIAAPTVDLRVLGTIPLAGRAFLDASGTAQIVPQPVVCQVALATVGAASQPGTRPFVAPGRLRAALTGAAPGGSMLIQIQVNGLDPTGATVQETLTFSGAIWADNPAPSCQEQSSQFGYWGTMTNQVVSQNTWASITSWQVLLRQNDGTGSAVAIFVDPDSVQLELSDSLPLCSFQWDGTKTCDLVDDRPISLMGVAPHSSPIIAEGSAYASSHQINGPSALPPFPNPNIWWVEDFREPQWLDATQSTLDRGFDGCRGRVPDGLINLATYVSRPFPGILTSFGAPQGEAALVIMGLPNLQNAENNLMKAVASLSVRIYQGSAGGTWPGPPISVPSPFFGVAVPLPGGTNAINRVQVMLTTTRFGWMLKGLAVVIAQN